MRKFLSFGLAALMLGFLSTACIDPIDSAIVDEGKKVDDNLMVFSASLEQLVPETKTALSTGNSVVWSEGDQIRVYSSSNFVGEVFTLISGAGTVDGVFSGTISGSGPYYAIYPADAAGTITYEGGLTLNLSVPTTQQYAHGSFGKDANISWAMAESTNTLYFHNVFGAVSFTLTGSATIKAVNLYTRGSDVMNGKVKITNLAGDGGPWVSYLDTKNQSVSLDCGEGVMLNGAGVTFHISVPAGAFADGFIVEFIDSEGNAMIKSAPGSSSNVINRGVIREMPSFAYAAQYKKVFLEEADDFAAFSGVNAAGSVEKQCVYKEGQSQYAFLNTDGDPGSRYIRFQDWTKGYSLAFQFDVKDLTLGAKPVVAVKAQGATGTIATSAGTMKVIKKTSDRAWLYDDVTKNGFVIKLED